MARSVDVRRGLWIAIVAFLGGFLASQCTQRVSARSHPVLDTRPIDRSIDVSTFNCAGFAFRTYRYMSLHEVREVLARCRELTHPDEPCPPGWIKIWAWEYDVHKETDDGRVSPSRRDGHIVAGRTSRIDGSGPQLVYCKYAGGPIEGPGAPKSWALPRREEVGVNATGHKVYVVRENVEEHWYCAPGDELSRFANGNAIDLASTNARR